MCDNRVYMSHSVCSTRCLVFLHDHIYLILMLTTHKVGSLTAVIDEPAPKPAEFS